MIYVDLVGRIGNQLFIYAMAEALRQRRGGKEKIVFYDRQIIDANWKNSLKDYKIENVEYIHDLRKRGYITRIQQYITDKFYKKICNTSDRKKRFQIERKFQPILNTIGIIACYNNYVKPKCLWNRNLYIRGYFQSEKYFSDYGGTIKKTLNSNIERLQNKDYVKEIRKRNTVCVSIKVEHNVGSPIFDVCNKEYYTKAIDYIIKNVDDPLFFICSDNVPYVLSHFIDTDRFDCICQEKELPVSDSLAIMGLCKHFVMGNSSFAWWAQYLCDNPNKIVIAPYPWLRTDECKDIYCDGWHTIDVTDYIEKDDQCFNECL